MKKLLAFCSIPAAILAVTAACDSGSNVVDCTTDEDCADLADTPVCDPDALQCVADTTECANDADCQVKTNEGAADNQECTATADCAPEEACVLGFDDQGYCVVTGDQAACTLQAGVVSISAQSAEGAAVDVCVDDNATCTDGACGYP